MYTKIVLTNLTEGFSTTKFEKSIVKKIIKKIITCLATTEFVNTCCV